MPFSSIDILQKHTEQISSIEEQYKCTLRVYGSYATGTATESSDIDFLVTGLNEEDQNRLQHELEDLLDRKIDLVRECDLFYLLKERIMTEAYTVQDILNGKRPAIKSKSPLLYLSGIEQAARRLRNHSGKYANVYARQDMVLLEKMYRRLQEVSPHVIGTSGLPWKPIRRLVRIQRKQEQEYRRYSRKEMADIRRNTSAITRRMKFDREEVARHVANPTEFSLV